MMGYDSLTEAARELELLARAGDSSGLKAALTRLDRMCDRLVVPEPLATF